MTTESPVRSLLGTVVAWVTAAVVGAVLGGIVTALAAWVWAPVVDDPVVTVDRTEFVLLATMIGAATGAAIGAAGATVALVGVLTLEESVVRRFVLASLVATTTIAGITLTVWMTAVEAELALVSLTATAVGIVVGIGLATRLTRMARRLAGSPTT